MNMIVAQPPPDDVATLPALIENAIQALAGAKSAADVMAAREVAASAYEVAARIARLKRAGQEIVERARQAQAAALEIETQAQMRLAAEYAAGQQRGEIGTRGRGKSAGKLSAADVGLPKHELFRAKLIDDAEERQPGIVHRILADALAAGREPNKALLRRALPSAATRCHRSTKPLSAVIQCRMKMRRLIIATLQAMPEEADRLVLFGELNAELARLKTAKPHQLARLADAK
jgi:hypothetical protein